ncbi:MAG TPA: PLDc N-terminal domain-containing protein, partial [Tichowtungia sp.]|nr:PLDc N-terminal domain-containing protein [Tichowtungia sp.]
MLQHPVILALGTILHLITFGLITLHSLRRRRNAGATLLWIFIAWAFPVIGAVIYLSFGIDRVPDRSLKKLLSNEQLLRARQETTETAPRAYWHNLSGALPKTPLQTDYNRTLNALLPDHPSLAGNEIIALVTGDEAYPEMLDAIRSARHHIHLQTFILGNDAIGRQFMEALAEKARDGVEVRLLYDRFGSTRAHLLGLFKTYRSTPNLHIAGWTQANY